MDDFCHDIEGKAPGSGLDIRLIPAALLNGLEAVIFLRGPFYETCRFAVDHKRPTNRCQFAVLGGVGDCFYRQAADFEPVVAGELIPTGGVCGIGRPFFSTYSKQSVLGLFYLTTAR